MIVRHRLALAALAPLALALAACGNGENAGEAPTGELIAPIAAPAGQSWVETAATTPEGGVVVGNPQAPIRLVEYASHTCPACATFSSEAGDPLDRYVQSGVVSFEIRNQVHNALDLTLAMLVRCGSAESFHPLASQAWGNLDQILATAQTNGAALDQATEIQGPRRYQAIAETAGLLDFFAARGISRDQALQCLADPAAADRIATNSATQSDELGVTGTPTFFLNGTRIDAQGWEDVEAALQRAGARPT